MKLHRLTQALLIAAAYSAQAADDRYIIQVDTQNKGQVIALAKKMGGEVKLDAQGFFAATFKGKSLAMVKGLMNNPHIKLIEADPRRSPMSLYNDDTGNPENTQLTPYAIYQSQADQLLFDGNAGIKVCIIDSGLDASNPDFVWGNIDGDNDPGTGNWNVNGGPHGTHVAGTIAAADNGYGVVGMAPGVNLHIIKVFEASGWAYSSTLAHAANLCGNAGANIISMSLGGGSPSTTEQNAFNTFSDAGGLSVAAAGNDGNNARSYPAGYTSVMMVGAVDADDTIATFSQYPGCTSGRGKRTTTDERICVEISAGGVDTLSTYPAAMATVASLSADGTAYDSSAMENGGSADAPLYFMGTAQSTDAGAAGKICLIDRGVITFHDKVKNCQDSGGLGAVIVNNEPGMLYGTLGDANTTSIVAVGAALEDRTALLGASTASINIGNSDYGYMSGTSMATPAVSGVAALVWSHYPECNGEQIRAVLKASADDKGTAGHDVYYGYGIVKAKDADDLLAVEGCGASTGGGGDTGNAIELSATPYKQKGIKYIDLVWSGTTTSDVDIYRDNNLLATVADSGAYTDNTQSKGGGSYTYRVCDAGSSTACSAEVTVIF